jgi:hypothetical protein
MKIHRASAQTRGSDIEEQCVSMVHVWPRHQATPDNLPFAPIGVAFELAPVAAYIYSRE